MGFITTSRRTKLPKVVSEFGINIPLHYLQTLSVIWRFKTECSWVQKENLVLVCSLVREQPWNFLSEQHPTEYFSLE